MVKINLNKLSGAAYVRLNNKSIEYICGLIKRSGLLLNKDWKENIYRMSKGKKISISFLKKLKRSLDLPSEFIYKNISLITSIKNTEIGIRNPKLPFNFNSKCGVKFIAAIMGDGELNKQIQIRYNNKDKKLVNLVHKSAKKVFGGVNYKIYFRKDKTYQLHFPKIIGLAVLALGIKPGNKVSANNGIPKFVLNTNNKIKAIFIRQFFNDEGNVRSKDRRLQVKQTIIIKDVPKNEMRSKPEIYSPKVIIDLKRMLSDLGISSKIYLGAKRDHKSDWELSIYGKENLEKFRKLVGFDLDYKNRLLDRCIKSYKFPSAPRNGRIDFAFEKFIFVERKYGFVTKYLLAKESRRSLKTVTYYLIDLKKKGIIKRIKKGTYKSAI